MKYVSFFIGCILLMLTSYSCKPESNMQTTAQTTRYFLIRHAEKERADINDPDPDLTEAGKLRAENWGNVLKDVSFDAVYSTAYKRTMATALPVAKSQGLEIKIYAPEDYGLFNQIKDSVYRNILVVGHSNTIPFLANAVLGTETYEQIEDDNNGNLYIITITGDEAESLLMHIN